MNELNQVLLEPVPGGAGHRRIKATEWPDPEFVDVGVRGDLASSTPRGSPTGTPSRARSSR